MKKFSLKKGAPKKAKTKNVKIQAPKRPKFDAKEFQRSLNSLNKDNFGNAPIAVQVFLLAMIVLVLSLLAYFLVIAPKKEQIASAESQEASLLQTFQEKESQARHLDEYKEQVAQMEVEFQELLNQLPQDDRTAELVYGVNMVGTGSGIRFQNIETGDDIEQEFFIEKPISITALGNYHQFGSFISGLATLPRIMTMHDFEVVNPQPSLDTMPELQMVLQTKTYRGKSTVEEEVEDIDTQEGN